MAIQVSFFQTSRGLTRTHADSRLNYRDDKVGVLNDREGGACRRGRLSAGSAGSAGLVPTRETTLEDIEARRGWLAISAVCPTLSYTRPDPGHDF